MDATMTRPHACTMRQHMNSLQQQEQANPVQAAAQAFDVAAYMHSNALQKRQAEQVQHPAVSQRVPLNTTVRLANGVFGVVSGHNPNDCQRVRVSWFSRHFWAMRHVWVDRTAFEVVAAE